MGEVFEMREERGDRSLLLDKVSDMTDRVHDR